MPCCMHVQSTLPPSLTAQTPPRSVVMLHILCSSATTLHFAPPQVPHGGRAHDFCAQAAEQRGGAAPAGGHHRHRGAGAAPGCGHLGRAGGPVRHRWVARVVFVCWAGRTGARDTCFLGAVLHALCLVSLHVHIMLHSAEWLPPSTTRCPAGKRYSEAMGALKDTFDSCKRR